MQWQTTLETSLSNLFGERQEIAYLPLPPEEGWGEGAFFSPNASSHALTPGPSPELSRMERGELQAPSPLTTLRKPIPTS